MIPGWKHFTYAQRSTGSISYLLSRVKWVLFKHFARQPLSNTINPPPKLKILLLHLYAAAFGLLSSDTLDLDEYLKVKSDNRM